MLEYLLKPVDMNALRSCLLKAAAQSDPKEASPVTPMTMEELDGSGIKNPYAKEMLRYIQEHYSERISLTELSQQYLLYPPECKVQGRDRPHLPRFSELLPHQ